MRNRGDGVTWAPGLKVRKRLIAAQENTNTKSQQWTTSWHLHSAERTSSLALDSRRRADPPRLGRLGLGRARAHEEGCECKGAKRLKRLGTIFFADAAGRGILELFILL